MPDTPKSKIVVTGGRQCGKTEAMRLEALELALMRARIDFTRAGAQAVLEELRHRGFELVRRG